MFLVIHLRHSKVSDFIPAFIPAEMRATVRKVKFNTAKVAKRRTFFTKLYQLFQQLKSEVADWRPLPPLSRLLALSPPLR